MSDADWNFVVAAYGLTWVVLAAYGLFAARRARRAERDFVEAERKGGAH